MKILVTGGAGFIGSNTINLLEKLGHSVLALDNFVTGSTENLNGFMGKIVECDITDRKPLRSTFAEFQPEAVLHLAAQSAISVAMNAPQHDLLVNGIGTLNVINVAKEFGVKRFVFSSSSAVYSELLQGDIKEVFLVEPSNPYGISKLAAEQYIRTMFPNHLILRYANIYGPRQKGIGENQVIALAFAHFIHGGDFKVVGSGDQTRDFVFVEDIAYCNLMALASQVVGTFNAASGRSYSVNDVLESIEKIFGVKGYKWEHTSVQDPRGSVYLDNNKIFHVLGWASKFSMEDGLLKTYDWWEKNK